jgi:hypothetical protein
MGIVEACFDIVNKSFEYYLMLNEMVEMPDSTTLAESIGFFFL